MKIAAGAALIAEGKQNLAKGKARLGAGKKELAEGKAVHGAMTKTPLMAVAGVIPGPWTVATVASNKILGDKLSEGEKQVAEGNRKVKAGEHKLDEGKQELQHGIERIHKAILIRNSCIVGTVLFTLLGLALCYMWRRALFRRG